MPDSLRVQYIRMGPRPVALFSNTEDIKKGFSIVCLYTVIVFRVAAFLMPKPQASNKLGPGPRLVYDVLVHYILVQEQRCGPLSLSPLIRRVKRVAEIKGIKFGMKI